MKLLYGDCPVISHKENGITYVFDVTKCMFSSGNANERFVNEGVSSIWVSCMGLMYGSHV